MCSFVFFLCSFTHALAARYSREIHSDFYVGFGPGQRVLKTSVVCCCCRRFACTSASSTNKIDPIKCETIGNCIIHVEFSQFFLHLLCSFGARCCQTVVIARLFVARFPRRLRVTGYGYISTASAGDGLHVHRTAYVFEAQLQ